jgi:nitroreductase
MLLRRGNPWFAATRSRHSRRDFDGKTVASELLEALDLTCTGFRPYPDSRVELVRSPAVDVFRGAIGSYGKVTGAPHLLVMIVSTEPPAAQQHVGYTGEACVLEATALGLDTCWVGGFFSRDKVAKVVELREDETVVAVSPVGHALGDTSRNERIMERMAGSHRRRPIEQIAQGAGEDWPAWARAAVECARIAPSALNRQPWRFSMDDAVLVISRTPGEMPAVAKALDCGIAMLHAELGTRDAGVSGRWRDCDGGPDVARFEPDPEE